MQNPVPFANRLTVLGLSKSLLGVLLALGVVFELFPYLWMTLLGEGTHEQPQYAFSEPIPHILATDQSAVLVVDPSIHRLYYGTIPPMGHIDFFLHLDKIRHGFLIVQLQAPLRAGFGSPDNLDYIIYRDCRFQPAPSRVPRFKRIAQVTTGKEYWISTHMTNQTLPVNELLTLRLVGDNDQPFTLLLGRDEPLAPPTRLDRIMYTLVNMRIVYAMWLHG